MREPWGYTAHGSVACANFNVGEVTVSGYESHILPSGRKLLFQNILP